MMKIWFNLLILLGVGMWFSGRVMAQSNGDNLTQISFAQLGEDDLTLISPANFRRINFPIPAEQQIQGEESYLHLHYQIFYGLDTLAAPPAEIESARFTVTIEGIPVVSLIPKTAEAAWLQIPIPWGAVSNPDDTTLSVRFELFSGDNCQQLQPIRVLLYADSFFQLVWQPRPVSFSLPNLPSLLQRNQAMTETLTIIVPDNYSPADLAAAAAVSAAVGQQTDGNLTTQLQLATTVSPDQLQTSDLVLIGRPDQQPLLADWYAQELFPSQWLTPEVDLQVTPLDSSYQFTLTQPIPGRSWANRNFVVEIPPYHQWQSCTPSCVAVGRLVRWALPTGSSTFTATLQIGLQAQPIIAAQTPLTLTLRSTTDLILHRENSLRPIDPPFSALFYLNQTPIPPQAGLLQLIPSPFNPAHFALVVSGASDTGLMAAAGGLATNYPLVSSDGRLAIVHQLQPFDPTLLATTPLPTNFTLAEIGFSEATLNGLGDQATTASFHIPANWQLTEGATLQLRHLPAATLDPALSGLRIELNGQAIGTVTGNGTNREITLDLPIRDLRVGQTNNLRFVATMFVSDPCAAVGTPLAWWRISNQSELFIPHSQSLAAPTPAPAGPAPDLSDLLFVLPANPEPSELASLQAIASQLGRASQGFSFVPQVWLGPIEPATDLDQQLVIAIGRPTTNPLIGLVNEALPQPFLPGSDMADLTIGNVIYSLPAGTSLGLIQRLPAPWQPNRPLWVVTGTTGEGVLWASRAFASFPAGQPTGDLIVVQGEQILAYTNPTNALIGAAIEDPAGITNTTPLEQLALTPPTPLSTTSAVALPPTPQATPEIPANYFPSEDQIPAGVKTSIIGLFAAGGFFTLLGLLLNWWQQRANR